MTDTWDRLVAADPYLAQRKAWAAEAQQRRMDLQADYERKWGHIAKYEPEAVEAWRVLLGTYFVIEDKVKGTHWTGKRLEIDMLLHPRFEWHGGGHYPIGFEIKRPRDADGLEGNAAKSIGQAVDYCHTTFDSKVNPDVGLVYVCLANREVATPPLAQMLGQLGVGYLGVGGVGENDNVWNGLTLRVSFNRRWSEKYGPARDKWSARRKVGSR